MKLTISSLVAASVLAVLLAPVVNAAMPPKVGDPAPDFTLKTKTADGPRDVTLSENFGKTQTVLVVLSP